MENKIRIKENVVLMEVTQFQTGETFEVKANLQDLELLQSHYWAMRHKTTPNVTCSFRKDGKLIAPTLHKMITGSRFVEFKNGDHFDFRRDNLKPLEKAKRNRPRGVNLKGNPHYISSGEVTFWITDKQGKKTNDQFIIDLEDLDLVTQYTWNINRKTRYIIAMTREGREDSKTIYLHRLLMKAQPGDEIDHINRIKSDNRRKNLRFCTRSENHHNKREQKNTTWGTGVTRDRYSWVAHIQIEKKLLRKNFKTFEEAVAQRKAWEKQYNPSGLIDA